MNWEHFSNDELKCKCGCDQIKMDTEFMSKLILLRKLCKFPLPVSSGYRCPTHNDGISTTGLDGPHTTGRAVDIMISGKEALEVLSLAYDMGFTGVGVKQKGMKRFIHLDDLEKTNARPRPWLWSY